MKPLAKALLATPLLVFSSASFADDNAAGIAKDFCHAVAAQALCSKTFVMRKGTEARMSKLAGQKLRGSGVPLNTQCEAGYTEFYTMEDANGLNAACQTTLGLFGKNGTRRAGLVFGRSIPVFAKTKSFVTFEFFVVQILPTVPRWGVVLAWHPNNPNSVISS